MAFEPQGAVIQAGRSIPDGHLVGSIGEVVAAEALGLTLYPPSHSCHDAFDENGDVQIKMTAGNSVGMYSCCDRLVVLRIVSADEAEIIYDGPGSSADAADAGRSAPQFMREVTRMGAIAGVVEVLIEPTPWRPRRDSAVASADGLYLAPDCQKLRVGLGIRKVRFGSVADLVASAALVR